VHAIFADKDEGRDATDRCSGLSFTEEINLFAKMYAEDKRIASAPGKKCRDCQFRVGSANGLKSGFDECWKNEGKVKEQELREPFVFDVWKFTKADALIEAKKYFVKDMSVEDVAPKKKCRRTWAIAKRTAVAASRIPPKGQETSSRRPWWHSGCNGIVAISSAFH